MKTLGGCSTSPWSSWRPSAALARLLPGEIAPWLWKSQKTHPVKQENPWEKATNDGEEKLPLIGKMWSVHLHSYSIILWTTQAGHSILNCIHHKKIDQTGHPIVLFPSLPIASHPKRIPQNQTPMGSISSNLSHHRIPWIPNGPLGSAPGALDGHPQREWRRTWLLRHTCRCARRPMHPEGCPHTTYVLPEEITLDHPKNIM